VNHRERTNQEDPMPARQVRLEQIDATELADALTFISQWLTGPDQEQLADALTFISQWLTGPDQEQLAAAFARFVGTESYDLTALRTDLARFTFLLGHDDGEQLFGTDEP
jgi:hypothetical protein